MTSPDPALPGEPLPTTLLAPPAAGPTPEAERLPAVDGLRGLALLGVALVNSLFFFTPAVSVGVLPASEGPEPAVRFALDLLVTGKASALLAFLFGAGLAAQRERSTAGLAPRSLAVRRPLALVGLGLAHGLLLWSGDILAVYGVLGLLLAALLLDLRPPARAAWAVGLVVGFAALLLGAGAVLLLLERARPEVVATMVEGMLRETRAEAAAAVSAWGEGPYAALFAHRSGEFASLFLAGLGYGPQILGLMAAGAWATGSGLWRALPARRGLLRRAALVLLPLGLAGEWVAIRWMGGGLPALGWLVLGSGLHALAAPALALGAAALLLSSAEGWAGPLLRGVAPLGRLSLSAYLLQSLVLTTLAAFYGAALFGRIPPSAGLALAASTWAVEAALAPWWARRLGAGPAERLVRRLAYGRAPARATARP